MIFGENVLIKIAREQDIDLLKLVAKTITLSSAGMKMHKKTERGAAKERRVESRKWRRRKSVKWRNHQGLDSPGQRIVGKWTLQTHKPLYGIVLFLFTMTGLGLSFRVPMIMVNAGEGPRATAIRAETEEVRKIGHGFSHVCKTEHGGRDEALLPDPNIAGRRQYTFLSVECMAERVPTNSSFVNFAEAPPRLRRRIELVCLTGRKNAATMLAIERRGGEMPKCGMQNTILSSLDEFPDLGKGSVAGNARKAAVRNTVKLHNSRWADRYI